MNRRTLCSAAALASVLTVAPSFVLAAENDVQIMSSELELRLQDSPPRLYLSVNWEFDLESALSESLSRGIALYFVYEFRLQRTRWYWFNKDIRTSELVQRISFSPLSRQFRLSRGGLTQSLDSLEQVLPLLKQIRDWPVADVDTINNIDDYAAQTRIRLDISRLPKPLQVTVGGNSDWLLESAWEPVKLTKSLIRR